MPPALSYRPLRPAIRAPPSPPSPPPPLSSCDGEPAPAPKRKRRMVAVACNNCRFRKIACDGKRPFCGQCARRPAAPRACGYRDKHETHAVLRRRAEVLQAEATAHENTISLLINLPEAGALRLLHHLRSTRPPPQQPPLQQNDGKPPPSPPAPPLSPSPFSCCSSASPLPDAVGPPPRNSHGDDDDKDGDNDGDNDGDDNGKTENHHVNPIPLADDATLPLSTINSPFDSSWPPGPTGAFVYPPPMPDSGEYLFPYGDGPSALGRLPTTPTTEEGYSVAGLYLE